MPAMTAEETREHMARINELYLAKARCDLEVDRIKLDLKQAKDAAESASLDLSGYLHGLALPTPLFEE